MNPLSNHKVALNFMVNKSKDIVVKELAILTKQATKEDVIQLNLRPSLLDPLRGRGIIKIHISDSNNNSGKTDISCEIIPTFFPRKSIYALGIILLLWTIVELIISLSFYSIVTVLCGWSVMFLIVILGKKLNETMLENYITSVVKTL